MLGNVVKPIFMLCVETLLTIFISDSLSSKVIKISADTGQIL